MRNIYLIIILLHLDLSAQFSFKFQEPKTPEVYQMEKYGSQDVNLYTGRPNVNIPLYEIKYGNISIPLNLSYSSNGIKGDEEASRVGLGWYMDLPMITQTVQGYDDLSLSILQPDYYYYYKPYYIVQPQPDYWYEKSTVPGAPTTGPQLDRLNISNGLKANPEQHLNDFFMAKVRSDGNQSFFGTSALYYPRNGSLYNYNLDFNTYNYGENYDIEMDIFNLNLFGHQVTFYKLPNQNKFYCLNKKNYKINVDTVGNKIYVFTVIDPLGTKYLFEEQLDSNMQKTSTPEEYSTYINSNPALSTPIYSNGYNPLFGDYELTSRQWKLTQITDINNNVINLSYLKMPVVTKTFNSVSGRCDFLRIYPLVSNIYDQAHSPYPLTTYSPLISSNKMDGTAGDKVKCYRSNIAAQFSENSILHQIIFGNSKVNFSISNRNDILNDKRIDSISILNNDNRIKVIKFNYSYYPENHTLSKRMKLDNLIINKEKYSFVYNLTDISNSTDYWGYYNGIPSQTPYINPFRLYKNSSEVPQWAQGLSEQYKNSENKSAHPENSKVGILEKIIYPTGGYSTFEYELNTFDNYFFPNYDNKITVNKNSFTINHLNIDTNLTNRSTPSFSVNNGDVIGGTISLINGISGSCQYSNSSFKIVKIPDNWISTYNSGAGGREYFWYTVDGGYIPVEIIYSKTNFSSLADVNFSVNITSDATLASRVKFDSSCPTSGSPIGSIKATFGSSKYNNYDQDFSSGFGLRIKSISDYNESGLVSKKKYQYFGGKHIPPYKPVNGSDKYYQYSYKRNFASNPNPDGSPIYISDEIQSSTGEKITSYSSVIFQNNFLGNGDFVGYDNVTVDEVGSNGLSKGTTKFYFSNNPDKKPTFGITDGTPQFEMDKFGFSIKSQDTKNGALLKKETFDSMGKMVKKDSMNYININFHSDTNCYNVKVLNNGTSGNLIAMNGMVPSPPDLYTFSNYYFYYYPLKGNETLLASSVVTDYINGNQLKTTTSYNYDRVYNLFSSKNSTYPDGNVIWQGNQYTFGLSRFNTANILSLVTEQSSYKNGKLLYKKGINFDDLTHYSPTSEITYQPDNSVPTTELTYNQYDSKGNLQQYTAKNGISTAIVWGYNQTQPIAKVEGATYAQVSSLAAAIISASNDDAGDTAVGNPKEQDLLNALDAFRNSSELSGYQITTYTYDPLIGVRSITPPSGVREVYIYDTANRLKEVKDLGGNILKEYQYHYKP